MIQNNLQRGLAAVRFVFAASIIALGLSGCGGGKSGDGSEATVRPKTMDGLVLSLDNCVKIEFIRNAGSPAALKSGDIESGTFIYTSQVAQSNLRYYDNLRGDKSNLGWPQDVNITSYTYRAINDSSGVLTLKGTGQIQSTFYSNKGFILNGSLLIPFITGSYYFDTLDTEPIDVQIDLTFNSNGSNVTTELITLSLPTSTYVSTFDTVRMQSVLRLATGGLVPENYNPDIDGRPSKIVPASLKNLLMSAINGIPDPTKNFTVQFVPDASQSSTTNSNAPDEIGQAILKVHDPALPGDPPQLRAVSTALDYTWRRIPGTDTAELVLSNIPDDFDLPFDASLNGTYTLSFSGVDSGTYAGSADSDTPSAADVSGTFLMLDGESGL